MHTTLLTLHPHLCVGCRKATGGEQSNAGLQPWRRKVAELVNPAHPFSRGDDFLLFLRLSNACWCLERLVQVRSTVLYLCECWWWPRRAAQQVPAVRIRIRVRGTSDHEVPVGGRGARGQHARPTSHVAPVFCVCSECPIQNVARAIRTPDLNRQGTASGRRRAHRSRTHARQGSKGRCNVGSSTYLAFASPRPFVREQLRL
jgi:hypothetical protein